MKDEGVAWMRGLSVWYFDCGCVDGVYIPACMFCTDMGMWGAECK